MKEEIVLFAKQIFLKNENLASALVFELVLSVCQSLKLSAKFSVNGIECKENSK